LSYEGDVYLDGTVKSYGLGKTGTGKVQLAITFDTTSEEHPIVTAYLYFTDAAMEVTERALRALGWDPVENQWKIDDLVMGGDIMGAKASLTCAFDTYEDKRRFKVKFINDTDGGGLKERLSDDEARSFAASLRQKLGVTGGALKKASPKKQQPQPVGAGPSDDDIPF